MSNPRIRHTATRLANGRVLVTGGFTGSTSGNPYLSASEVYAP